VKTEKKIVLIHENEALAKLIAKRLLMADFDVNYFASFESYLTTHSFDDPALYIIAIDDKNIIKEIRKRSLLFPVIHISPEENSETNLRALKDGADQYMSAPLDMNELFMRVHIAWEKYMILSRYAPPRPSGTM